MRVLLFCPSVSNCSKIVMPNQNNEEGKERLNVSTPIDIIRQRKLEVDEERERDILQATIYQWNSAIENSMARILAKIQKQQQHHHNQEDNDMFDWNLLNWTLDEPRNGIPVANNDNGDVFRGNSLG